MPAMRTTNEKLKKADLTRLDGWQFTGFFNCCYKIQAKDGREPKLPDLLKSALCSLTKVPPPARSPRCCVTGPNISSQTAVFHNRDKESTPKSSLSLRMISIETPCFNSLQSRTQIPSALDCCSNLWTRYGILIMILLSYLCGVP